MDSRRSRDQEGGIPATAESQRLINKDPTKQTFGLRPASMRRSMPRRYASAAARYCFAEQEPDRHKTENRFLDDQSSFECARDTNKEGLNSHYYPATTSPLDGCDSCGRGIRQQRADFQHDAVIHSEPHSIVNHTGEDSAAFFRSSSARSGFGSGLRFSSPVKNHSLSRPCCS